ncbi:unnamed protein product, partial [Brachionus calyciflorus]
NNYSIEKIVHENGEYVGCYKDNELYRDLRNGYIFNSDLGSNFCFDFCREKKFEFAAIQYYNESFFFCSCDNRYGTLPSYIDNKQCLCTANGFEFCGCRNFNRVYRLNNRTKITEISIGFFGCYSKIFQDFEETPLTNELSSIICSERNLEFSANYKRNKFTCLPPQGSSINGIACNSTCANKELCEPNNGTTVYHTQKTEIVVLCPNLVQINETFTCNISIQSQQILTYDLTINYGDSKFEHKSLTSNGIQISKAYASNGLFTINILVGGRNMSLNPQIYVSNNSWLLFSNMISNKTFNSSLVYSYADFADYIGCFSAKSFQNAYSDVFKLEDKIENPYECMKKCMNYNYSYAIIGQYGNCRCTTRYGMLLKENDDACRCVCQMSSDNYCGCEEYFKIYQIRLEKMFDIVQARYLGCYIFNFTYFASKHSTYNTNGLCLDFCRINGYSFFSTYNGFYCNCENGYFPLSFIKIDENECNYKCPGNNSQTCGGYFGPRSFFEILTRNIHLTSFSNFVGKINENLQFRLESNYSYYHNSFEIDFGDDHKKNLQFYNQKIHLDKNYTNKGLYNILIRSSAFESTLKMELLITNDSIIEKKRKLDKDITIYENGELIGCFKDTNFESRNHQYFPKNQEVCGSQCKRENFIYSAVSSEENCFCGNSPVSGFSSSSNCMCGCAYSIDR